MPQMKKGSQPTDGGYLVLNERDRQQLLLEEPSAKIWLRPYLGGEEFINNTKRWCLWLKDALPEDLRKLPKVMERVANVQAARLSSPTKSVQECANTPTLFTQDRQPDSNYLAIPEVSSQNRHYIPIGFLSPKIIASNKLQIVIGASLYHFGILSSTMHMSWVRAIGGRLKSDYSYSPSVYNNYPWPISPVPEKVAAVESAAQAVLDARAKFPDSSLADLYDPLTMPPILVKAHKALDTAVDKCYRSTTFKSELERVEYLFELYEKYTSGLIAGVETARPRSGLKSQTHKKNTKGKDA
jgi:hypothetical protein